MAAFYNTISWSNFPQNKVTNLGVKFDPQIFCEPQPRGLSTHLVKTIIRSPSFSILSNVSNTMHGAVPARFCAGRDSIA